MRVFIEPVYVRVLCELCVRVAGQGRSHHRGGGGGNGVAARTKERGVRDGVGV